MTCRHNIVHKAVTKDVWQCMTCFAEFIPKPKEKVEECKQCFGDGKRWCGVGCLCQCHKPEEKECENRCPNSVKLEKRLCEHYYTKHEENKWREALLNHLLKCFDDHDEREIELEKLRSRFLK